MSDVTVVSLLPYAIQEIKPGLVPDIYRIEPSDGKIPSVLHVSNARSFVYIGDGKTFPASHPAEQIAEAIVNDYWSAQLQSSLGARPALFWLPGKLSPSEIVAKYGRDIDEAKKRQNLWFMNLVKLADDDWAKTHQHRAISDIQRYAAKSLGMINKPWYHAPEPEEFARCPACMTLVPADAALCQNCKYVINRVKAKELGIRAETFGM